MGLHTEFGEVHETTVTYPGNGREYTTPFDVNVYENISESGDQKTRRGRFIGKGAVLGVVYELSDYEEQEATTIIELDDGTGQRVRTLGFLFEVVPVDADSNLSPETETVSFMNYATANPPQHSA